jgi:hypothetical protein
MFNDPGRHYQNLTRPIWLWGISTNGFSKVLLKSQVKKTSKNGKYFAEVPKPIDFLL